MKIGVIGDLHFKDKLGYSEYVDDRRLAERQNTLDQIYDEFSSHDLIVFMGDNLNSRNNSSKSIKDFVRFVERFDGSEVVILAGNHEKYGDGRSAIDFMKYIKHPWYIVTNEVMTIERDGLKLVFSPFFYKTEWYVQTDKEAVEKIQTELRMGDILFSHAAFTGINVCGAPSDDFNEPVLDREFLDKNFKKIVIGHIHSYNDEGKFLLAGSVFCNEANELEKSVWTIDTKTMENTQHRLKQAGIKKIVNPSVEDLRRLDKDNLIVKAEITSTDVDLNAVKKELKGFYGSVLVEKYHNQRSSIETDDDIMDYSVENMIELYAKTKKLDPKLLHHGYELVKR